MNCALIRIATLAAVTTIACLSCAAETLEKYAEKCDKAIGYTVPDFVCDMGALVPDTNAHGDYPNQVCDRPNQLNQECDPGSRFQLLLDNADAAIVAHCRKKGRADGKFGDIAVIQYSKINGATCFYQALGTLNGDVKAPSKGIGSLPWIDPPGTAGIRCAGCHDNGPLIRSPYLTQLKDIPGETNVLPGSHDITFNSNQPYAFVGSDFATWETYKVEVKGNYCNGCHRMSVSNLTNSDGTALDFGIRATTEAMPFKNGLSADSPMWMLPKQAVFKQEHLDAANEIRNCALRHNEDPLPDTDICRITLFAQAFAGDNRFVAIWAKLETDSRVARHGMSPAEYQAEHEKLTRRGMHLAGIDGYEVEGQPRLAAAWEKTSFGPRFARHGMTGSDLQKELNRQAAQGLRPIWLSGYTIKGQDRYAAIWEKSAGPHWVARHGMTSAEYRKEFDKQVADGFRLVVVSGYASGTTARYAAIWQKDLWPTWSTRHGLTASEYQAESEKRIAAGFRLAHISVYRVGRETLHAAIWDRKATPAWTSRHGMTNQEYQERSNILAAQGYRLIRVTGY